MRSVRYLTVTVEGSAQQWREAALCRQVYPDLFHPGQGQPVREAKAVCARCPVRTECLAAALGAAEPPSGVWGGTSEQERLRMRRANRRAERRRGVAA